jgi:hypothetical protein
MNFFIKEFKQGERNAINELWTDSLYHNGHLWAKNKVGGREYNEEVLREHELTYKFIFIKQPYKLIRTIIVLSKSIAYLMGRIWNKILYFNKNGIFLLTIKLKKYAKKIRQR